MRARAAPILLGALLVFAVGEIAARRFLSDPREETSEPLVPHPYLGFSGRPNATAHGLGPQGFCGSDVPFKKPHGEFRVFFLGGAQDPTLPAELERVAHSEGRGGVRVYDLGVPGYVSRQELALLVHCAIAFRPDLVVVANGANDVRSPRTRDPRPGYPPDFYRLELGYSNWSRPRGAGDASLTLLRTSRLLRPILPAPPVEAVLSRLRKEVGYGTPAWEAAIAEEYLRNVGKMRRVARGYRFDLAVFLRPVDGGAGARIREGFDRLDEGSPKRLFRIPIEARRIHDALRDAEAW